MNLKPLKPAYRGTILVGSGLVLSFLVICAVMFFKQESFIYFPDKVLRLSPSDARLPYEEVTIGAGDGVRIGAWWVPAERPRGAVLLLNGNAGNRGDRLDKIALLHGLGLSVLALDYRGYGSSTGKPNEAGTYSDALAALDHMVKVRGLPPDKILLYGESLGGAVAIETAARVRCGGLIVESSFTSVSDMAKIYYPWLPVGLVGRIRYDSVEKVNGIGCPKLFMHSPDDEIVPYFMGKALFERSAPPKSFCELKGGHNGGGITVSPEAQRTLGAFLDGVLAPRT